MTTKRLPFPYFYTVRDDLKQNANHILWQVRIRRNASLGVLAQEIAEEDFLTIRVHLTGLLVGGAIGLHSGLGVQDTALPEWLVAGSWAVLGCVMGVMFNLLFFQLVWGAVTGLHREMEYRGQMVEVVWKVLFDGAPIEREVSAAATQLSYYSQFKRTSRRDIVAGLWEAEEFARKWVDANALSVIKIADRIGMDEKAYGISLKK
tara:strand:+ start:8895 stop:9509 length:615 start_codon:yes stop_codon:yes gene_type:complete